MKNWISLLTLTLCLFVGTATMAQDGAVDKKPLLEVFTASTCPPCVGGNLAIDGVLVNHPDAYTLIKYQMNWPGDGDPYYMEASAVRRNYYTVSGVPHLRTNGIRPHPELEAWYPQSFIESDFNDLLGAKTNISITAEGSVAVGTPAMADASNTGAMVVTCHVEVKAHDNYEAGLKTYIMVVEESTFENVGTNGETEFHNVVQSYVLSSEGDVLDALTTDQVITYDLSIDLTGTNTETGNDLLLVVFVQDPATMDVKQSEMVEITHPFVDYSASFNVYDEDFNLVDGGRIAIALAGETRIMDSKATQTKILPGTYQYQVVVPGLFPYDGEFTVTDTDVEQDIFLEVPPFLFYEDFEAPQLPEDWTLVNPHGNYFTRNSSGEAIYSRWSADADDAVYFVFPKIAIDQGCNISYKAGNSSGRSTLSFGIVSSKDDPAADYSEIASQEIFYADHMHGLGARIEAADVGDKYLCFKITSEAVNNWFYLDNVLIIENMPGYKVQFQVIDQNEEVLPEVEVTFTDMTQSTNAFGYATWRNCDQAEYSYSVSYKGEEIENGILSVDGDILKQVMYNTSGIEDLSLDPVLVYPNPARNQFTIDGVILGKIKVINLEGQIVLDQKITGKTTIQTTGLDAGVYIIQIDSEEGSKTQKLFINR
ncbi:MAG: T9SS type A sorting domain-containing protein [Bacteroidetes bacterium]|jgi:hypothetical protein|nr:T9SS type A sorting domain-containing protein [Bacteroidota bacterium]MBT4398691.1 T9SS type A sorting domain-containing protein [Bacteroidota bacterium]MBT4409662.1 T9SS type A sorting domain-containing protein [Bacteroidota bacterium]MBT5426399.1 T9SS type A sorting domain-containing protein [Bacteroidota bacterium]MBT7094478.1 T9SS type A sorting domain-containing protein [Bacteroidota bacterium]